MSDHEKCPALHYADGFTCHDLAFAHGAKGEQERIVGYLRKQGHEDLAAAIERGEHYPRGKQARDFFEREVSK